jgi:hypothetical protein
MAQRGKIIILPKPKPGATPRGACCPDVFYGTPPLSSVGPSLPLTGPRGFTLTLSLHKTLVLFSICVSPCYYNLLPLLTLGGPASARDVRVPRASAPRFSQPPGPIPRRPAGRRALRVGARPRRGRLPFPARHLGFLGLNLQGLSVGQGYNSANRETLAFRSRGQRGPAGRLLLASSSSFARLRTMGPDLSHPFGFRVPVSGPES